jgi:uncharacterized membrane protein
VQEFTAGDPMREGVLWTNLSLRELSRRLVALLSWADLSFIVPATSLSVVTTTLGAKWFLQERMTRLRWVGTLLVCLGVALLSLP